LIGCEYENLEPIALRIKALFPLRGKVEDGDIKDQSFITSISQ